MDRPSGETQRTDQELQDDLIRRAMAGDGAAFVDLVKLYDRALRSLSYRLLGDRDSMDDVLQEAYLRAFRALPKFRGDSSFTTWLYRIVHNACIDRIRSNRETTALDFDVATSDAIDRDVVLRTDIAIALDRLPAMHRELVLLVDLNGFDYAEAAAIVGVPVGTVRSRLSRARTTLRAALGDDV